MTVKYYHHLQETLMNANSFWVGFALAFTIIHSLHAEWAMAIIWALAAAVKYYDVRQEGV